MNEGWIHILARQLKKPLPGADAQQKMAPSVRYTSTDNRKQTKSAVMVVLYPYRNRITTIFIKRTEYEGVHSGQVSLPGGMYKRTDLLLSNTAIRETHEEIGIPGKEIQIIGRLTSLHIPVSHTMVYPYVGVCMNKPLLRPDPVEVNYIIECPVEELINPVNRKLKMMTIDNRNIGIPYFDIMGDHIWGATAMIISEFLEIAGAIKP